MEASVTNTNYFLLKSGLLFYVVVLLLLQKVNAEATFELKLHRFVNDEGLNQSGRCCAGQLQSSPTCSKPCRTAFRVCLTHFQGTIDPDQPKCTFGDFRTPVLGENSFDPQSTSYLEQHPIQFNFTSRWPRYFSLIIDVVHQKENELDGNLHKESRMMISRLIKRGTELPVPWNDKSWTSPAPYQHMRSQLQYSYRVRCARYLYGDDCAAYCKPRDDVFGHYTCNDHGTKTCLPGWAGNTEKNYCTEPICSKGCNPEHGSCTKPNECKCNLGWRGRLCDQCISLPGCVHGKCKTPYQCTCDPGWGGLYCNQDLNYCTNHDPCKNGALCSNTGQGSYTCACRDGFTGNDCEEEIDECSSSPCNNGTECVDLINGYRCICPNGFSGRNCKQPLSCRDSPCKNGGKCRHNSNDHYVCECSAGWSGAYCEQQDSFCSQSPCHNGATCEDISGDFLCRCRDGYDGKYCEKYQGACSSQPCLHGATCLDLPAGGYKCRCLSSFKGQQCELNFCNENTCSYGGRCIEASTGSKCVCLHGFVGADCGVQLENCEDSNLCANGGTCMKLTSNRIRCECSPGFVGPRCRSFHDTRIHESFSTSQWLAICFGAAVLVLVLIFAGVCLLYYRRKRTKGAPPQPPASDRRIPEAKQFITKQVLLTREETTAPRCGTCQHERHERHERRHKVPSKARIVRESRDDSYVQRKNTTALDCVRDSDHGEVVRPISMVVSDQTMLPLREFPSRASVIFKADVEINGSRFLRETAASPSHGRGEDLRDRCGLPANAANRLPTYEEACEERHNLLERKL